jgi:hypothetical protein
MLLQGSMHIFNFCLLFLGLCFFFIPKNKKAVLVSMVFSILFASFRYIPATVTYYERGFVRGYTNYQNLLHLLTRIAPFDLYAINGVGLWEFYFFIGGLGLGFVLLFGVLPIFVKEIRLTPPELTSLHLPILLMAVLSIGTVWESLTLFSKLSVLTAERVPARFLIISFLFLALFSSIQLDRVLARFRAPLALKIAALAGLVYEGYVLLQNGRVWRLYEINTTVLKFKEPKNLDYRLSIINHVDPAYTTPLLIAWGITILSVLFVLYYTRRRSANSS